MPVNRDENKGGVGWLRPVESAILFFCPTHTPNSKHSPSIVKKRPPLSRSVSWRDRFFIRPRFTCDLSLFRVFRSFLVFMTNTSYHSLSYFDNIHACQGGSWKAGGAHNLLALIFLCRFAKAAHTALVQRSRPSKERMIDRHRLPLRLQLPVFCHSGNSASIA